MPGTNAGTGQPNWFTCAKHRLDKNRARFYNIASDVAAQHVVTLTGRKRPRSRGGGLRMTKFYREYRCACGHVGWSAHIDLQRREESDAK